MAILYPRKQTVMLFIICLAAVLGTSYYVNSGGNAVAKDSKIIVIDTANISDVAAIDSALIDDSNWKTQFVDSKKSYSEIKSDEKELTMTDRLGRDFFSRYIVLKQNNLLDDQESVNEVINQSMDGLLASAIQPKIYFKKDILVFENSEIQTEEIYLNAIGSLLLSKLPHENASLIASQALDGNDPKALQGIDSIVAGYAAIVEELKIIQAPARFADYHLDLLNGISAMQFVSEGMDKVFSDPVSSLIALNSYGSAQNMLRASLLQFKKYIQQSNHVFAEGEGGYIFLTIN